MAKQLTAWSGAAVALTLGAALMYAQGRGSAEWTTSQYDAQHTGAIATDPRISVETMSKPGPFGPFKFLWKLKLEYEPNALTALTQPVLLDRLIGFRGFKSIAFVGTASGTVHAIDVDFGTRLWKYNLNYTASPPQVTTTTPACPGGLTAALSRPTSAMPPGTGGGGGGFGRGGRSGGGVGEPGRGAITLATAGQQRGGGAPPPAAPVPQGGAGAAAPGSAAAAAGVVPGDLPAGARAGGGGGGGGGAGRGGFTLGADAAYVVGIDGYLHALNVQNGWDQLTPTLFVPANTRATGLIVVPDGSPMAYLATTHGCGSQPDSLWAMKLSDPQKTVIAYQPKGSSIAGMGFSFGRDGAIYAATTAPSSSEIVSLDPRTLTVKASATLPQVQVTTSPTIIQTKAGPELIAVAGGGKVWLLESAALAKGSVASAALPGTANFEAAALTSYVDTQGTRWIAAPTSNGILTMKIVEEGGRVTLAPGWTSRAIPAPFPAIVVNGVLFAASAGTKTVPAVLYALEASTGRELWTSARTITSTVTGGLSAGQGNVYVPTADGTLYAFGFAIDK